MIMQPMQYMLARIGTHLTEPNALDGQWSAQDTTNQSLTLKSASALSTSQTTWEHVRFTRVGHQCRFKNVGTFPPNS